MKKNITNLFLALSLLIILESISFWNKLIEFLFAGIVPGTDTRISPNLMLMLIAVGFGFAIAGIFILPLMRKYEVLNKRQTVTKSRKLSRA